MLSRKSKLNLIHPQAKKNTFGKPLLRNRSTQLNKI